jgi:excisionase family DNA binding protein
MAANEPQSRPKAETTRKPKSARRSKAAPIDQTAIKLKVLTVTEVSELLRVHPTTVYRELSKGDLPGFRIGKDWRFNVESINKWVTEREKKAGRRSKSNGISNPTHQ